MKTMKLAAVQEHTGRSMTVAEAITRANPNDRFLGNMIVALNLHTWNNTADDWLRLQAAMVIQRNKMTACALYAKARRGGTQ